MRVGDASVLKLGLAVIAMSGGLVQVASGATLTVNREDGGAGTGHALEMSFNAGEKVSAASGTWVAIGGERGLRKETALRASLVVDPQGIELAGVRSGSRFEILSLRQDDTPEADRVVLFLERLRDGRWASGAVLRDALTGRPAVMGRGVVLDAATLDATAGTGVVRLELEWMAATGRATRDGYVRVFRADPQAPATRTIVAAREGLDNSDEVIDQVRVGLLGPVRGRGTLRLDDFSLERIVDVEGAKEVVGRDTGDIGDTVDNP